MKKFDNIVIVTDLDGTFLDDKERTVPRNLEAIEYFKENGGYFTIATGRVAGHALGAVPGAKDMVNLPAVTCNGACLYDFRTGQTPFMKVIEYETAMEIISFIKENFPRTGIRASAADYCFVSAPQELKNPYIAGGLERYGNTKNLITPFEKWKDIPIMKVVLRLDADILPHALSALRERFGDELYMTQSWPTIIDIQPSGVNKGVTLARYVRETLGESVRIYACGDYINDIEMLREADVAVCPSNAHEDVKRICDLCLGSNNDGLIADLVEHIENNL